MRFCLESENCFVFLGIKIAPSFLFYIKKRTGATIYRDLLSLKKGRTSPVDGHIGTKEMQDQAVLHPPHRCALLS